MRVKRSAMTHGTFQDGCNNVSYPTCSSTALTLPNHQVESNLLTWTNIKSWKWQWVLSVARSQRVNNAPALLAGTSAFGVLNSMEEVQWTWTYHAVRKSGSHGQAMCRYSGWQSQMRPQPTDSWHHHRHQPLDIRVEMLPDDRSFHTLKDRTTCPRSLPAMFKVKKRTHTWFTDAFTIKDRLSISSAAQG